MGFVNPGICNKCAKRVPAEFFDRDGQKWIRKDCPDCGVTESLVSTDAAVWQAKRDMWHYVPQDKTACSLHCDKCKVDHKPGMVFLDVTNRCNMNCPICIATIKGMGFEFTPPMEYFEKIFAEISTWNPVPMVELFGGEPTMREDLLEIIGTGRKYGLKPRVVTNGLKLANEEYCKKLCESGVRMRFAFDGRNADIYEKLRGNRAAYDLKLKAIENLKKYSRRKHAMISCAAYGFNDQYMADLIQYVHDNRDLFSEMGIIPLTENWEPGAFQAGTHTTMEDVEKMVKESVPGGDVEFVPAGLSYAMRKPRSFFRKNTRSETLLLAGVHPNCESITLLVSDGKCFRSVNHYLKKKFSVATVEFLTMMKAIEPKLDALNPAKFFQRMRGRWLLIRTFTPWVFKTVSFKRLLEGKPVRNLFKMVGHQISRMFSKDDPWNRRRPRRILRLAMLPFEEVHSVDGARMEQCKAVFAYVDTADDKVKSIQACMWYPYRNALLEKISQKYGIVGKKPADAQLPLAPPQQ
ncbi:MAG: radical SAM protein [Planctomycetaceae bacterium]|nr:radical SAM protein [Planctomycetaceae bacterium]